MFDKKVPMLKAFYYCQVQEDLKDKINIPNKGNVTKVCAGEIDRKINGPLLINLCFNARSLPVCAENPQLPQSESDIIIDADTAQILHYGIIHLYIFYYMPTTVLIKVCLHKQVTTF